MPPATITFALALMLPLSGWMVDRIGAQA